MSQINRKSKKYRWFRTNTHDPECMELLKRTCKCFDRWFYITHTADDQCDSEHLHLVVMHSPVVVATAARQLGIPENFVQPALQYKMDIRYLIHLDDPEKKQYSPDDVFCSHPGMFRSLLKDSTNDFVPDLFDDLRKLRSGFISQDEFIQLHLKELQEMTTYQKIKIFEYFDKIAPLAPHRHLT